jgi:hypothetical protein
MPVYMLTFHAYGTWWPDRSRGYVRRGEGVLPPDDGMARRYRDDARFPPARFDEPVQRAIIDESQRLAHFQQLGLHIVATDPTHAHLIVSWRDDRRVAKVRIAVKQSLSRRLRREFGEREWFVDNASRKRVRDKAHLHFLRTQYLPSHRGLYWRPDMHDPAWGDPSLHPRRRKRKPR